MQLPRNRILLVEDHPDTQALLTYLLKDAGYDVTASGTCSEGLQIAETEWFDLYMVDGLLPDGTGLDLCRLLQAVSPRTPILFHSGLAYEADKQRAFAAGAQEFIAKPANPDEITTAIARLINQEQTRYAAGVLTASIASRTASMVAYCG